MGLPVKDVDALVPKADGDVCSTPVTVIEGFSLDGH